MVSLRETYTHCSGKFDKRERILRVTGRVESTITLKSSSQVSSPDCVTNWLYDPG